MKSRLLAITLATLLGAVSAEALARDRIIVKFRDDASGRIQTAESAASRAATVMQANAADARWVRARDINTHIYRFNPAASRPADLQAHLNRLNSDPRVEYAVMDRWVQSNATSNDTFFTQQWSLAGPASRAGGSNFTAAWDTFRGSASTVVAVVDTGVLRDHPDLKGRLLPGYDFIEPSFTSNDGDGRDANPSDPGSWVSASDRQQAEFSQCSESSSSWHGTYVAGLIAGNTNDGSGTAGANWNARILPIRALGKCGGYLSDVMDGARWAAGIPITGIPNNPTPAVIINLSLGSAGACDPATQAAINQINARGAVVVAAAGNGSGAIDSPASCNGVIAVGAVDADGLRARYSALGSGMSLMAPGGDQTPMTGPGNTGATVPETNAWFNKVGTSFAAPMVSAALSLMHGITGRMSYNDALNALRSSARAFPSRQGSAVCTADSGSTKCVCTTSVCGAGLLDANNLVNQIRAGVTVSNASLTQTGNNWVLDASESVAASGRAIVSHAWVQVAGPQNVTMTSGGIPGRMQTAMPSAAGEYIFRVTVQDSAGASHQSLVSRTVGVSELGSDGGSPATPDNGQGSNGGMAGGDSQNTGGGTATPTPVAGGTGGGGGGGGSLPPAAVLALLTGMLLLRQSSRNAVKA